MAEKEEHTAEEKLIQDKVTEILKSSDMDKTTEAKVRKLASEQLGLDLSQPHYKQFVRGVVNSYIVEHLEDKENPKEEEEEKLEEEEEVGEDKEEEGERDEGEGAKEYDDNGDLIICRISSKRRVTWGEFRGRKFLSIREYYDKEGKEFPSAKGMALTAEQWACFKENVPAIEEAIKKIS